MDVVSVEVLEGYTVRPGFEDETIRTVDLDRYLSGLTWPRRCCTPR